MTLQEFEAEYRKLGNNLKTKDIDGFNKCLIREKKDVSFLRPVVKERGEYYRTYYQVSLAGKKTIQEKMAFVEDNFDLMNDWWHTDILPGFLGKSLEFDFALEKARGYVTSPLPYVRRWGYVLFIPRLVRDSSRIGPIFELFHNDEVYHVVMAQAWLISYLAMCDPDGTYAYLRYCDLKYNIVGRAIQKICDSYVVSAEDKERFKSLRPVRREIR